MPSTIIHTSIDPDINAQANSVFSNFGLSENEAVALFFNYVAEFKKIPFAVNKPNNETLRAVEDARNGNVQKYDSLEHMWSDLDED